MKDLALTFEQIPPDKLHNNSWNSNVVTKENLKKLRNSMDSLGSFKPIIARRLGKDKLEILGGAHRNELAKADHMPTVPVIVINAKISDDHAKKIGMADNERYGEDDGIKLIELIASMDDPDDLPEILPYSEDDLAKIINSVQINVDEFDIDDEDVEVGQEKENFNPDTQIMRFKVQTEDAEHITEFVEKIMKQQGFTKSDALTNAGDALVYIVENFNGKKI